MNPLYNQLFNPQYANQDYLQHLHWQQHDTEQRQEIMNAVKAIPGAGVCFGCLQACGEAGRSGSAAGIGRVCGRSSAGSIGSDARRDGGAIGPADRAGEQGAGCAVSTAGGSERKVRG